MRVNGRQMAQRAVDIYVLSDDRVWRLQVGNKRVGGISYNAFFVLAIVFMVLGIVGHGAYIGVGAAFLVFGLAGRRRQQENTDESISPSVKEE
jgi:hypothetical protein